MFLLYSNAWFCLQATAINCLSAALSVSPLSIEVKDMLVAEVSAGNLIVPLVE